MGGLSLGSPSRIWAKLRASRCVDIEFLRGTRRPVDMRIARPRNYARNLERDREMRSDVTPEPQAAPSPGAFGRLVRVSCYLQLLGGTSSEAVWGLFIRLWNSPNARCARMWRSYGHFNECIVSLLSWTAPLVSARSGAKDVRRWRDIRPLNRGNFSVEYIRVWRPPAQMRTSI